MKKPSLFARFGVHFLIATIFLATAVAQTKKSTTHAPKDQANQKVSMRQMGMGKMKNSERWKAAIRHSDRRASVLRLQGKKGVK